MSLSQLYLVSGKNKIDEAIDRIKHYDVGNYVMAFGGGKDSIVTLNLTLQALGEVEAHYCRTGIDHPELVRFIRAEYPQVLFIPPLMTMWEGILIHGLPPRQMRWCCEVLKEHDGEGKTIIQGVRWAESIRRRKRWDIYNTYNDKLAIKVRSKSKLRNKAFLNPIVDWSDYDVWEYIRNFNLPYCSLYDEGYKRLGCILCPFSAGENLRKDIARYPKIVDAYRRAANRYIERRGKDSFLKFKDGNEYFDWWINERLK